LISLVGNPRLAYYCFLDIVSVDNGVVVGIFSFSKSPCASTCRPECRDEWQTVSFKALYSQSKDTLLEQVQFSSHSSGLIPTSPMTISQIGDVLVGMFDQPHPGCFYLISY
jgi:hypothetical protein